jgi:signal peptidase I
MDTQLPLGFTISMFALALLTHAGLYLLFEKAGEKGWKALVPGYNYWVWVKLVDRNIGWFIAMLLPIFNVVAFLVIAIDLAKVFGRDGFWDGLGAMVIPWFYFPWLGMQESAQYDIKLLQAENETEKASDSSSKKARRGTQSQKTKKKGPIREWADAISFAVVAATAIRVFFFEAYTIPTPSMEGTLLSGDFLFVSKFHYGARVPNTPLAFPFAHHTMPLFGTKAYSDAVQLPYMRLWGPQDIKRDDIVVFNFPDGDTVFIPAQSDMTYYQLQREFGSNFYKDPQALSEIQAKYRFAIPNMRGGEDLLTIRPADKRENYIKRCVGLPGDQIEIRGDVLYVNGQPGLIPRGQQLKYTGTMAQTMERLEMAKQYGIREIYGPRPSPGLKGLSEYYQAGDRVTLYLSEESKAKLDAAGNIVSDLLAVDHGQDSYQKIFPNKTGMKWTVDDFGPIEIPAKGKTIEITRSNLRFYERVISFFEHSEFSGEAYSSFKRRIINGEKIDYTFEMDYFWLMGDNRHQSQDSRFWGFVPEDHVVGKAWFVWFSWDVHTKNIAQKVGTIRLNRFFMPVRHGK